MVKDKIKWKIRAFNHRGQTNLTLQIKLKNGSLDNLDSERFSNRQQLYEKIVSKKSIDIEKEESEIDSKA